MINDAITQTIQECANIMARLVQEKTALQMRVTQLETELQKPIKKIPKNMKDLSDAEKPEPEPKE